MLTINRDDCQKTGFEYVDVTFLFTVYINSTNEEKKWFIMNKTQAVGRFVYVCVHSLFFFQFRDTMTVKMVKYTLNLYFEKLFAKLSYDLNCWPVVYFCFV